MSRSGTGLLAALLSAGSMVPAVLASTAPLAMEPAHADRELLERVLRETGVERVLPGPSWNGYVTALLEAFAGWLADRLGPLRDLVGTRATELGHLAQGLLIVVLLLLLALLLRLLWLAARRRPPPARPAVAREERALPERDREAWKQELERRVTEGDVAGALVALWWLFARSVCGARVDSSWTSRELLERSGRSELRPLARALDQMTYGSRRPTLDEVRGLLGRLEEALP